MQEKELLLTPIGRQIQGSFYVGKEKDMKGKQLTDKNNNPIKKYFVALAIEKNNPELQELIQKIQTIASMVVHPGQKLQKPEFSWKFYDGDADVKEGSKGCVVFKFETNFAPKVYGKNGDVFETGKNGDFYRVAFTVSSNGDDDKPGLKLYMQAAQHAGYGKEINTAGVNASAFEATKSSYVPEGMLPDLTSPSVLPSGFPPFSGIHPFLQAPKK